MNILPRMKKATNPKAHAPGVGAWVSMNSPMIPRQTAIVNHYAKVDVGRRFAFSVLLHVNPPF